MRIERSSTALATLAGKILNGAAYTHAQVLRLAASVLTQAADQPARRAKARPAKKVAKRAKRE